MDERAGRAFVLNANNGGVGVYDAASGRFLGTFNDGAPMVDRTSHRSRWQLTRVARLFVITGGIFGYSPGTRLSVLDTRSGRLVRIPRVSMFPDGMVVDERLGRTFVSSAGGMSILDDRTGRVLRMIPGLAGELALDEQRGHLFVTTGSGSGSRVRIADVRSGALLLAVFVGQNPVAMAVDERNGRVFIASEGPIVGPVNDAYVPTGMGSVTDLDGRSGAILRTIPVGADPVALAVDQRTQRVFVITGGGTIAVHGPDAWSWVPAWLRRRLPFLPRPAPSTRSVPAGVTVLGVS